MSIYRNAVWFAKGMLEYTRYGYQSASKNFLSDDLNVDCNGNVYMVTGASSGLGKVIATELARKGGCVHIICRNKDKAESVKQMIIEQTGNQKIYVHIVDLAEPRKVYEFAEEFLKTHEILHVLINNAGLLLSKREMNSEGLEKHFAVNMLGVHILTSVLVPLLSKSVEPRVITMSSGGMLLQKLDVEDLQFEKMATYDGAIAYAQTKRQQVVMCEKYADRYPGIHFSTVNPGWADTPGVKNSLPVFYEKMQTSLRTPAEGADTAVWLAVSSAAIKHPSGLFFQDRKPVSMHLPLAWTKSNPEDEEKLYIILDEMVERFKV